MNKKHGVRAIQKDKDENVFPKMLEIMISIGISLAVFIVLLLLFALYSASQDDPRKYMLIFGIASAVLGSLSGGFTISRFFSGGIAMSIIVGVVYALSFLILRLIFAAGEPFEALCVLAFYPGLVGVSVIGSIIGRYRPDAAKSRKKRIKKFTH